MAGNNNTVTQTLKLDVKPYTGPLKEVRAEAKSTLDDIGKELNRNSQAHAQNETQVRKWGASVKDELMKVGKAALTNLGTGAKALTLGLGGAAIKKSADDAMGLAFSFSKAFAEIRSRSNASEKDLDSWQKSIRKISVSTKADMGSMAEAFKNLSASVKDPGQLMGVMDSIGKAAAMGDGDATKISSQVQKALEAQGKEINSANVDDYLRSSDVLRRKGKGFANIDESTEALGSLDQSAVQRSGLSSRQLADSMAALTQVAGKEKGVAGLSGLLKLDDDKFAGAALLKGIVGDLHGQEGKLDLKKLKGTYSKALAAGGGDEKGALSYLKLSGLSGDEAEGILSAMKNADKLSESLDDAARDTKSFAESASQGSDNLTDAYRGFENSLVDGVTDILGGFQKPLSQLLKGDLGGAAKATPGAIGQALGGIADHPLLVGGALATVMGGGALISSLLGKVPGLGGVGGIAGGIAEGKAVQAASGATPVFVVNASEISAGLGGGGGAALAGPAAVGFASKILPMLAAAVPVTAAVGAGAAIGYGAVKLADKVTGGGYSNVVGAPGAWLADKIYGDGTPTAQKVVVEIHSKDPAYSGIPKNTDLTRNASSH